ncbi:hypothetical protein BP6252_13362 [Coleophoma cylindrospora]|uniref:NADP-dependent oxidoreductase domain-containing protein n=1 Tax=Coleophoma cylindrospora TaxID=1849047 RepID=A0A3D8QAM2_9HELO|nr:hypothetical protein BP6252_13362 [Coleophoma cylindrospora]
MSYSVKEFTLNTGAKIPAVGFGTWKAAPGDAEKSVLCALASGYKHIDCAPLYYNEPEVGRAFAKSPVPRSEIFVTTKLWSSDHQRVEEALNKSLADLQLEYVDLYLMHWPVSLDSDTGAEYGKEDRTVHSKNWDFTKTWALMEKLVESGKVKAIGVCNCSTVNLEKLLKTAKITPAVNQTELHPLLPQDKLNAMCKEKGIHQTAFGPLGGSGSTMHTEPTLVEIGERRGKTPAQVMLSWGVQKGWSVLPKSVNPGRIKANLEIFDLTDEEMAKVDTLAQIKGKRFNVPNWGVDIFHDDEGLNLQ